MIYGQLRLWNSFLYRGGVDHDLYDIHISDQVREDERDKNNTNSILQSSVVSHLRAACMHLLSGHVELDLLRKWVLRALSGTELHMEDIDVLWRYQTLLLLHFHLFSAIWIHDTRLLYRFPECLPAWASWDREELIPRYWVEDFWSATPQDNWAVHLLHLALHLPALPIWDIQQKCGLLHHSSWCAGNFIDDYCRNEVIHMVRIQSLVPDEHISRLRI